MSHFPWDDLLEFSCFVFLKTDEVAKDLDRNNQLHIHRQSMRLQRLRYQTQWSNRRDFCLLFLRLSLNLNDTHCTKTRTLAKTDAAAARPRCSQLAIVRRAAKTSALLILTVYVEIRLLYRTGRPVTHPHGVSEDPAECTGSYWIDVQTAGRNIMLPLWLQNSLNQKEPVIVRHSDSSRFIAHAEWHTDKKTIFKWSLVFNNLLEDDKIFCTM
ncbi:hypothetical protein J6590_064291 [Homalodisca vitripennis]|nr:hypothetical protein J6590_064291 [Homalodisca vitripennis]